MTMFMPRPLTRVTNTEIGIAIFRFISHWGPVIPIIFNTELIRPLSVWKIYFHKTPHTTTEVTTGVNTAVRKNPQPLNLSFSRLARPRVRIILEGISSTVNSKVCHMVLRNVLSLNNLIKLSIAIKFVVRLIMFLSVILYTNVIMTGKTVIIKNPISIGIIKA